MAERSNTSSTSSLTLPTMPGASPDGGASPRRAVSPLLEVRRPHCTLNCETCNAFLEDLYRHSRSLSSSKSQFSSVIHFFFYKLQINSLAIRISNQNWALKKLEKVTS